MTTDLLRRVRADLAAAADPARAPGMQAYMKSAMPYHGAASPVAKRVFKAAFQGLAFADAAGWEAAVRGLWDGATHREERYAALALAKHEAARAFQTPAALPLYRDLIVAGAWWDYVDDLATHHVGDLLRADPAAIAPQMRAWSRGDDLWLRRAAIICQVGSKRATDLDLLYACIEPALGEKDFFLRKAIGWALRDVAWWDPDATRAYVAAHADRLSPLSQREALKNLKGA